MAMNPPRAVALEWCRNNAPDLRIQHDVGASGSRFTYGGEVFTLETTGDDHADAIVALIFQTIRAKQGDPVREHDGLAKARAMEQQIVAARFRGQDAEADVLEQELLRLRAGMSLPPKQPRVAHEGVFQPQTTKPTRWQW